MAFAEIAGGIASIGTALSGAASAASQVARNKRQYKWTNKLNETNNARARENAQWQLDQQERMLREQRQYDSPLAQMQRMKQAGLNPNLIYGQMSDGSAPVTPSTPDTPSDQFQILGGQGWSSVGSSFSSAASNLMQMAKLNSEIENIDADTANKTENTKGQSIDNETKGEKNVAEITKTNSEIKVNQETENKIQKESKILQYNLDEILPKNNEKLKKEIDKLTEEISQIQQITPQMVAEYQAKIKSLIAGATLSIKQAAKVQKEIDNYDSYIRSVINLNGSQSNEVFQRADFQEMKNKLYSDFIDSFYRDIEGNNGTPKNSAFAGHKVPQMVELMFMLNMMSLINKTHL